jgi:hypothetical protein
MLSMIRKKDTHAGTLAQVVSGHSSNLRRYRVPLDDWSVPEILFYKHEASERWWMEVLVEQPGTTHRRPSLVPCAEADYSQALAGEIPDRWWKAQYRG